MTLGIFVLIIVGGFLLFGYLYDRISKKKKTQEELETAIKNSSCSNMVYKETYLNETRNHQGDTPF
ncbi:hypothetical protein [Brevibacillus daliensis]|uniref:hypothetical protein n=1 Tax=Brevibacillus daliensis TaxID=2892995 RepID=UPI001E4DA035|nr:hypothetical protein [Brevibacillus daliensis]